MCEALCYMLKILSKAESVLPGVHNPMGDIVNK